MRKTCCLLLALLMLMLNLTACGSTSPSVAPPSGSVLVYGSGDYDSINPIMNEHCEIRHLLFDGLLTRNDAGEPVPALAKDWSYDEENLTYYFTLRDDVRWHDGTPFTAEDVCFTIEAIMDPENGSENHPNFEEVSRIDVLSDTEIAFVLSEPNSAFPDYMTVSILPAHLLQGEDMWLSEYFRQPVGTGPYRFSEWDAGQAIVLTKNEDYFAGPASIDTVIFKIVPDDAARALQLKNGELDLAQVTPRDAAALADTPNLTVYEMETSDYRGILYNFGNEYWQKNADLIPAISYAIDRQAMVDAVLLGKGEAAYSPLQRNKYNFEGVERYDYAPEQAEAALAAAGCVKNEDGFWYRDGARIGFTINATAGDQVRIDMAQIAAQQLQQIGLDVRAAIPAGGIDWANQECCIIGWGSPFDADDHTYKVFGTDKGANYSGYSNDAVDTYLMLARRTDDDAERAEYYKQFQIAMAEAPAYTFFCYLDAMYVADSSIRGIDADAVLGHHGVGIFRNITEWTIE